MKNKKNLKRIKLIAGTLALSAALSACSVKNNDERTPETVYVYVTATPTPNPNNYSWANETRPSVPTPSSTSTTTPGGLQDVLRNSTPTPTPAVDDGWWAEDSYLIWGEVPSTQPTSQTTVDELWALNDEEEFWRNLYARFQPINETIDNFSFEEARQDAVSEARTLIDFIFYGGTMNGITFQELTEQGRQEVYSRLQALDARIMEFYPDYKTDLGALYDRVRNFASTTLERAREIFSGNIDIDINVYPNGETTQSTMNANRAMKLVLEKK